MSCGNRILRQLQGSVEALKVDGSRCRCKLCANLVFNVETMVGKNLISWNSGHLSTPSPSIFHSSAPSITLETSVPCLRQWSRGLNTRQQRPLSSVNSPCPSTDSKDVLKGSDSSQADGGDENRGGQTTIFSITVSKPLSACKTGITSGKNSLFWLQVFR